MSWYLFYILILQSILKPFTMCWSQADSLSGHHGNSTLENWNHGLRFKTNKQKNQSVYQKFSSDVNTYFYFTPSTQLWMQTTFSVVIYPVHCWYVSSFFSCLINMVMDYTILCIQQSHSLFKAVSIWKNSNQSKQTRFLLSCLWMVTILLSLEPSWLACLMLTSMISGKSQYVCKSCNKYYIFSVIT